MVTVFPHLMCCHYLANICLSGTGILDALNIKKAHIVGHDWGSSVAWAFAGIFPQRTIQLITMSTGHPAGYLKGEHRGAQKQKSWYC